MYDTASRPYYAVVEQKNIDSDQIKNELVLTDNGLGGNVVRKTDNMALFNVSDISKMPYLERQTVDEIWETGWDNFVSENLS